MKIEWQIKTKEPRFLEVKVDGELFKEVSKSLFRPHRSALSACKTKQELIGLFTTLEKKAALNEAFRLLATRDHFMKELREKLQAKKLSPAAITHALDRCTTLGYLDEKALTERYAAALRRKGKGPRYIAQKLQEKLGYRPDLPVQDCREQIQALLARRPHTAPKDRQRTIRFLLARGFLLEEILNALESRIL